MAKASPRTGWPAEARRAVTEPARRQARYNAARERIQRIVDGMPALTAEQRQQLALMLWPEGTK